MNKKPSISVIIPTYNRAGYIKEAINSVLKQKGSWNLDVIVVDDGSTDDTEKIIKSFGNKIRYFKIPHSGLPAVARNFGISKAKGNLIAFQDSDDIWVDDKLTTQVPLFDDPAIMMSYGNAEKIDDKGERSHKHIVENSKLPGGEKFKTLLSENVISTLTVMIRKQALELVGCFDESVALRAVEDYDLWLRLSAQYPKGIIGLAKTLALYRVHSDNISEANDILGVERIIAVFDHCWDEAVLTVEQRSLLEEQLDKMHEGWTRLKIEVGDVPTISVVMSMYNSEDYLERATKSILDQTYKNFEFIVIDDGSSDNSADIIKSINDPRIRLIRQNNHGLVFSFNKGVRLARAEFVARMDSDDISMPSRFEKELDWITVNENRGLVGTFFIYMDKNDQPGSVIMTSPTKHLDVLRMMYLVNPYGHGSIMMRKKAVLEVGGYRSGLEPAEDFDLWTRIAPSWEVGMIPEALYWWRLHYQNVSHLKQKVQNEAAAKISTELWSKVVAAKSINYIIRDAKYYKNLNSNFREVVYRQYLDQQTRLAFEFLIHGRLRTGYRSAIAAIWLQPRTATKALWKTLLWAPIKLIKENNRK